MRLLTLTTDLGTKDGYVAYIKAQLLSRFSGLHIIDITHDIPPFDIAHAAYVMKNCFMAFPEGAIHMFIVNGHNMRDDSLLVAEENAQFFLAPDNGLLPLLFDGVPKEVVKVDISLQQKSLSDWMTSTAIQLLEGKTIDALGSRSGTITEKRFEQPYLGDNIIRGRVIYIDRFGNVHTNIHQEDFNRMAEGKRFSIQFHNEAVEKISARYNDVPEGELLCRFNESGTLIIAINQGRASQLLGLDLNSTVIVEFFNV